MTSLIKPENTEKYSFRANSTNFTVVSFSGYEAISALYEFEIILVKELDTPKVIISDYMAAPATFTIHSPAGSDRLFHGILSEFEEQKTIHENSSSASGSTQTKYIVYRAKLVPRFWKLTLLQNSRVFVEPGQTVKTILEKVLKTDQILNTTLFDTSALTHRYSLPDAPDPALPDNQKNTSNNQIELEKKYKHKDFVCQYEESNFQFISRWCEREGISYFFEQETNTEKIVFSCQNTDFQSIGKDLTYSSDPFSTSAAITSFTCRQQVLPASIILRDHHSNNGKLITISKHVDQVKGIGKKYIYGEYFDTQEEGNLLAGYRAEELLATKEEYFGKSILPEVSAGYTFKLLLHDVANYNDKEYLVKNVTHKGHQTGYLISGLSSLSKGLETEKEYENTFTVIPHDLIIQFRPARVTPSPKISGTLQAAIDAATSGEFAEIDDLGRYKVVLPFDTEEHRDAKGDLVSGKSSAYIRRMQPYASHYIPAGAPPVTSGAGTTSIPGSDMSWAVSNPSGSPAFSAPHDYGFHFPLHKGAEILLSFIDGNPDRPVIVGALSNESTKSPVKNENQTQSVIRDHFGNELIFESLKGEEEITLRTPNNESRLILGKDGAELTSTSDSIKKIFGDVIGFGAGTKTEIFLGASFEAKLAMAYNFAFGQAFELFVGSKVGVSCGVEYELKKMKEIKKVEADIKTEATKDHIITAGDGICMTGGMEQVKNSVINAYGDGIVLSYGTRTTKVVEDKLARAATIAFWATLVPGVVSALIVKGFEMAGEGCGVPGMKYGEHGVNLFTIVAALAQTIAAAVIGIKSNDTEEPIFHEIANLDALMNINKNGIKLGAGPSLKAGKIAPVATGDDAWKNTLNFVVNQENIELASTIQADKDGTVLLNSKDKEISLSIGGTGSEEAKIVLKKGNDEITIESGTSKIILKKGGNIDILSDKDISIGSKQKIELKGGDKQGFSYDGTTVSIIGRTFTVEKAWLGNKYFKVTN